MFSGLQTNSIICVYEYTYQCDYLYIYIIYACVQSYVYKCVCTLMRTHRQSNLAPPLWGILSNVTTTSFSSSPPVEILADAQMPS